MLEDKKKEIEKLRGWGVGPKQEDHTPSSGPHTNSTTITTTTEVTTPIHTPTKRSTPSSSRKRHASIIEAKSRQLVEEEGLAFRQQQLRSPDQDNGAGPQHEMATPTPGDSAGVQASDRKWYEDRNAAERGAGSGKSSRGAGSGKRRVHFDAEGIVLNAALEGELDLLKECITKVRDIYVGHSLV